jgi:hypothetical protein
MITIENKQVGTIKADTAEELLAILKYLQGETEPKPEVPSRKRVAYLREVLHPSGWSFVGAYQSKSAPRKDTQVDRILQTVAIRAPISAQGVASILDIPQSSVSPSLTDLFNAGFVMRRRFESAYHYDIRPSDFK